MSADVVLGRLEGVRRTGESRWIAKCPAHSDRGPSLSIRQMPDGRTLLHDFAGCDTGAVLDALGLTFRDLMPEALTSESLPPNRAPFSAADALRCLAGESLVIALAAAQIVEGKPLSAADADRCALAAGRIGSALEVTGGHETPRN